ncbi:hypothetical protein OBE_13855, partial [human gut metagenome]
ALLSGFPFLLQLPDVKGYDWLTFDQVNWYRQQSAAYKAKERWATFACTGILPYSSAGI